MNKIIWYGHSAFMIKNCELSVLIDPFFSSNIDSNHINHSSVDVVLITHDHRDHVGDAVEICSHTSAILGAIVGTAQKLISAGVPIEQIWNGVGFNIGGTMEYKGLKVTMTQAFHSSESGTAVGYIIQMPDGLTVYHAGDTCIFSDMKLWGQLYSIDVALLPIGGIFTMDATQAALACKLLGCKAVIPMHWGTFPILEQSTNKFINELNRICPDCKLIQLSPWQEVTLL